MEISQEHFSDDSGGFSLGQLIEFLDNCHRLLTEAKDYSPQDQWLTIAEILPLLHTVVVQNTCLDLYGFNKLSKQHDVTNLPPEEWLRLLSYFCQAFLRDCRAEYAKYGDTIG